MVPFAEWQFSKFYAGHWRPLIHSPRPWSAARRNNSCRSLIAVNWICRRWTKWWIWGLQLVRLFRCHFHKRLLMFRCRKPQICKDFTKRCRIDDEEPQPEPKGQPGFTGRARPSQDVGNFLRPRGFPENDFLRRWPGLQPCDKVRRYGLSQKWKNMLYAEIHGL